MLQFTHLLMEGRSKYSPNIKPYLKTHEIIDSIDAFSHITLNYNMLPPIRIKTRPTIFILKRKSNIKYDPDKARSQTSIKDFVNQVDDTKNIKLNTSFKEIVIEHVDSMEELEKAKETIEQNSFDIKLEETKKEKDTMDEKIEVIDDLTDDNHMTSMENTVTGETESVSKVSPNLRDKNEENIDSQENVSDISDVKPDKKTKIEENIKGKSKNGINPRQETHGVKETVKKMIQEKMLEVKQRREVNDERKNIESPIKPTKKKGMADLLKKIGILKQEVKEPPIFTDKSSIIEEEPKKLHVKDDELSKQKPVTQKKDKIKVIKSDNLESEDIEDIEEENEIVDVKVDTKKIEKSRDKVDAELSTTEAEIEEEDKEENIKRPKSINVRESIRNIINQFKEFEKDFVRDDTDTMASTNDMSKRNHFESDSYMEVDYSVENGDQVTVKDARESLKEIIDQFKYIKHELTSEEDDQFDEIAAKYMERPIAETLLQFSEALKALIQRRKKTSSMERAANSHDNNGIYMSENQRKSVTEESNVNSNNVNTSGRKLTEKYQK